MAFTIEQIQKELVALFGIGHEQHVGEYWDVLSDVDGQMYHTTNLYLRKMTPLTQEHSSLKRLIGLPRQQDWLTPHNVHQWMKRVVVLEKMWLMLLEMEAVLKPMNYSAETWEKEVQTLFSLSESGCTLPGRTMERRLLYWVKQSGKHEMVIDTRSNGEDHREGILFSETINRNGKEVNRRHRISVEDIIRLEEILIERYVKVLKTWMKMSVYSLRKCTQLEYLFEPEEWDILNNRTTNFSTKQLSYWMDRAGKSIPLESLEEWYGWEDEGA